MGVPDLLKFIDKAKEKNVNIIKFKGKTLVVDASCFIYKGFYSQSEDDLLGRKSTKCIDYLLKTAKIIANAGIHTVFIFDGQTLPSKKLTNDKREASREENRREAMALLKMGNKEEALKRFRRSYSISREAQVDCIKALRKFGNVDILVAPYEADAQLTFLVNSNLAYAAVTVDSDLLAFGCQRVIYNLNVDNAMCEFVEFSSIQNCFSPSIRSSFDSDLFRYMCILRGCDYFEGLKGMAFKSAEKFFSRISDRNPTSFIKHLKYITKLNVGDIDQFTSEFIRANNTFLYQIIFDPRDGCQKPLNVYPNELLEENKDHNNSVSSLGSGNFLWYAGQVLPPDISKLLAIGNDYNDILKNELLFTIPHCVSLNSIWSSLKPTHFKLNSQEVTESHLPSLNLSRKRKSTSYEIDGTEVVSVKRHLASSIQIIDRVNDTKENGDYKFIKKEEITCYVRNESLEKEVVLETKKISPLNVSQKVNFVNKTTKPRNIIITESKYFKDTSKHIEIELFSNSAISNVFGNKVFSKTNTNRSQEHK